MLKFQKYCLAESLEQAYELNQKKQNRIIGGGVWMKCCNFPFQTAIDLSGLGLNQIVETDTEFEIGCMTTLRQLEIHAGFEAYTQGAVKEALRHIVGTQFRNCATVGGSLFGRFGFSDVLTLFLALDSSVELYPGGLMSMAEFAASKPDNSILVKIHVKKTPVHIIYQSARFTTTDFPLIACCVSHKNHVLTASIGARPGKAKAVSCDCPSVTDICADKLNELIASELTFGSNRRASAEYRQHAAQVLIDRCCRQLKEEI